MENKYDTQLLIEGSKADEETIQRYIEEHFQGDCLLVVGDEEVMKLHYHTDAPWQVLEYCAGLGEIYDIVIEDMERQTQGKQG